MSAASDNARGTALSDATLDEIARVAGVSSATVSKVLAVQESFAGSLAADARDLLARAVRVHAGESDVVYFLQAEVDLRIKIGTTKNLALRLKVLRAISPVRLRLVGMVRGGRQLERMLHLAFAPLRCGRTEWFEPGESLVSYIRELQKKEVAR